MMILDKRTIGHGSSTVETVAMVVVMAMEGEAEVVDITTALESPATMVIYPDTILMEISAALLTTLTNLTHMAGQVIMYYLFIVQH